jgi:CRISPR-associated protein Csb2
VARFAIRSAVLPKIEEALRLGEHLRNAVMSKSAKEGRDVPLVFSGHGSLPSNHQHAMYLSTSYHPDHAHRGLVDSFVIVARAGFSTEEVLSLQEVRRLWRKNGHDLELVLVGLGLAADYGGLAFPKVSALAESTVWRSFTPFVPTRHPKTKAGVEVDGVRDQIRRACLQLLGVAPVKIDPIDRPQGWARFQRRRAQGGGRRGVDAAFGVRLEFDRPVQGPIALGYGAHFGLGLFTAEDPSSSPQIP